LVGISISFLGRTPEFDELTENPEHSLDNAQQDSEQSWNL